MDDDEGLLRTNTEITTKTTAEVIEEESLRYIGGYIVKKFSAKYPNLGCKNKNTIPSKQTWIDCVNRGELYTPSSEFFSQLVVMSDVFKALHGDALQEGKGSIRKLSDAIENVLSSGIRPDYDVPDEVIWFFSKISIYFRIRHLNNIMKNKKFQCNSSRESARKKMKITT